MLVSEKEYLESLAEGVVCFNHDGAFHFVNTSAANFMWGEKDTDDYYEELANIVKNMTFEEINMPHVTKHISLHDGVFIVCTLSVIDGRRMLVFNENYDNKNSVINVKLTLRHELINDIVQSLQVANEPVCKPK